MSVVFGSTAWTLHSLWWIVWNVTWIRHIALLFRSTYALQYLCPERLPIADRHPLLHHIHPTTRDAFLCCSLFLCVGGACQLEFMPTVGRGSGFHQMCNGTNWNGFFGNGIARAWTSCLLKLKQNDDGPLTVLPPDFLWQDCDKLDVIPSSKGVSLPNTTFLLQLIQSHKWIAADFCYWKCSSWKNESLSSKQKVNNIHHSEKE